MPRHQPRWPLPLRAALGLLTLWSAARAQENSGALPGAVPIPRMQVVPQALDQASFQRDGRELTRYHFAADLNRPFVFPVIGPSGRSLTRMGHPRDPVSHSHHNSVWISHNLVDGIDFWGDRKRGRIVPQRIEQYEDGGDEAWLVAVSAWTEADGTVLLDERRRVAVATLPEAEWLMTIDLELTARGKAVVLGKSPFGMIGVRMAKTIGVRDGGGQIRNSAGGVNEKEVFWKPARWVDYSGPIAPDGEAGLTLEGLTLFDHPANPNHPSVFHVRDDGWMGASLSFAEDMTIAHEHPLRLRYGLYVHRGLPVAAAIEARWKAFAATAPPPTLAPQKKK